MKLPSTTALLLALIIGLVTVTAQQAVGGGDSGVERCEPDEVSGFPISPEQIVPFTREWHNPPDAHIHHSECDEHGRCMDGYIIDIEELHLHVFGPDKPATKLYAYVDHTLPEEFQLPGSGPIIKTCASRQAVVRFRNNLKVPTSVHLHGAGSLSPYDGWADDRTFPGEFKDYIYPNRGARTLWYHDHSVHITSDNANLGLAGEYWVKDCCNPAEAQLPTGKYEMPLTLGDKVFDNNYQVLYDKQGKHDRNYYGDHNLVNGIAFPFLEVEPRKYRFHVLALSISRAWWLELSNGHDITVLATDGGKLEHPVSVRKLRVGVAERYEVIIDFTGQAGRNVRLLNNPEKDQDSQAMFCYSHYIAEFRVRGTATTPDNDIPQRLRPDAPMAELGVNAIAMEREMRQGNFREFDFGRSGGQWTINGLTWEDEENRVIAHPKVNGYEIWKLKNNHGGWFHPIHIHLVDFVMIKREVGIEVPGMNADGLFPWEVNAAKDVFYLGPGDTVYVIARFGAAKGQYMFHCHNLVHEDNDMMLAFDVEEPNQDPATPANTPVDPALEDPMSVTPQPQTEAREMDGAYLTELLGQEFYKAYYPAGQRDGKRVDCGNVWEVAYSKPCRQQCCMCGLDERLDGVCPSARSQTWETVECANGEVPPHFEAGQGFTAPRLSTVKGLALIDASEGDVHFADPLENPFTFSYEQVGSDKIVFCANLDIELQSGAGVQFNIKRKVSRQWRNVLQFFDTRAPYCVVQDEGKEEGKFEIRYNEIDPELGSGTYKIEAQVIGADGTKTPKYTQNIRIRGD